MDTMQVAGSIAAHVGDVTHEERIRLQKILYCADGWSLAWTGRRLLDDDFEAWREGPVVRCVYESGMKRVHRLPSAEQAIVDAVLAFYGRLSGADLTTATHDERPWAEARTGLSAAMPSNRLISPSTMRRCFVEQSIAGAPGPRCPGDPAAAVTADEVDDAARRAEERWNEALDELADR